MRSLRIGIVSVAVFGLGAVVAPAQAMTGGPSEAEAKVDEVGVTQLQTLPEVHSTDEMQPMVPCGYNEGWFTWSYRNCSGGKVFVRWLGASGGTHINCARVEPGQEMKSISLVTPMVSIGGRRC